MGRMQASAWVGGLVGGLVGGGFALLAGLLADQHARRNNTIGRVTSRVAEVITAARMMGNLVLEVQVKRLEERDKPATRLDLTRLTEPERDYTRAYVELSWLIRKSPPWSALHELEEARLPAISRWGEANDTWTTLYARYEKAISQLDEYTNHFSRKAPRAARQYLDSIDLPTPTPAGAEPKH